MSLLIKNTEADFSTLRNAPIIPRFFEKDGSGILQAGLKGLWLFASGDFNTARLDLSGNRKHLAKVGAPVVNSAGYAVTSKNNHFDTGLVEALNQTLIVVFRPNQSAAQTLPIFGLGNYDNDNASLRYGTAIFAVENQGADTLVYQEIQGYLTNLSVNQHDNRNILSTTYSARSNFVCIAMTTDTVNNRVRTYNPLLQQAEINTWDFTSIGSLANRKRTDDASVATKILIGGADDVSVGSAEILGAAYYDTVLTAAQITANYVELKRIAAIATATKASFTL